MLEKLYIRNYAIIEEITLEFGAHLNVMTGETGAGKSIIAGALSLVLGDRADSSVLINKEEKCIVEATFKIPKDSPIAKAIIDRDLDFEPDTTIRREISSKGKSRAFINDTPVNLSDLNVITGLLVDLHRQFDQYLLTGGGFEYEVLDAVSGNKAIFEQYTGFFKKYQTLSRQYELLEKERQEWQKEQDYKQFLFSELEEANLGKNELEEAEVQLKSLSHAEQIKNSLLTVFNRLEETEDPVNNELRRLEQELQGIEKVHPQASELIHRIESSRIELQDIARECEEQSHSLSLDPEQLQKLQERLDLGYRLMKKHGVQSTEELLAIYRQLADEIHAGAKSEEQLLALKKEREGCLQNAGELAKQLHQKRLKHGSVFAEQVNELLHLIGMPNAILKVDLRPSGQCGTFGSDELEFLWDANKSGDFKPVSKTASGGELSRIMLCIKALTAEAIDLPTLIFDEVDTGISGEAAKQVGMLLQKLGQRHQIICITHQPQVAGRGKTHFYVYKKETEGRIQTSVRLLNHEERIISIAQMIGGAHPSDAVLENAREIVDAG